MAQLEITLIPALSDNYVYLLEVAGTDTVAVVDPAEPAPVEAVLREKGLQLTHILNTHHHHDHTGGNGALKAAYGATLIGPKAEHRRIAEMDIEVEEGDRISVGGAEADVIFTPGHTSGHIAFHFPESGALFCGDTLFVLGCGRMFEGTPAQFWESLSKLRALPPETRIYCGHEYTQANARFAMSVDGGNPALQRRSTEIDRLRAAGEPTVPSTLAEELQTNPFLRADDPALAGSLGLGGADPVSVFADLRGRKDRF